jgi:hypothetical protein
MAYFDDLTPYTYFPVDDDEASQGAVNIGWLDEHHPFPQGETTSEFQQKLRQLCSNVVNVTCGIHLCPFCDPIKAPAGSAEIRVTNGSRAYAAPALIHHYVTVHRYRPPVEFIAAVLAHVEPH